MAKEKVKIAPDVCSYVDDEHNTLTLEIPIPGVDKKDLKVKMHEDSFYLSAEREDIDYRTAVAFCCPVKPEAAKAEYKNGLLKIEVPFKDPMEGAIEIKVK